MNERTWLKSREPVEMLRYLGVGPELAAEGAASGDRASDRKLRLYACALFRQLVAHGTHMSATNEATIRRVEARPDRPPPADPAGLHMGWAASLRGNVNAGILNILAIPPMREGYVRGLPRVAQTALLREVFANPFHPAPAVAPVVLGWGDGQVVRLAAAAYRHLQGETRELCPTRLAILGDALEDAGCDNADILDHLRSPGPHVRGCWAVDAVLGRE